MFKLIGFIVSILTNVPISYLIHSRSQLQTNTFLVKQVQSLNTKKNISQVSPQLLVFGFFLTRLRSVCHSPTATASYQRAPTGRKDERQDRLLTPR